MYNKDKIMRKLLGKSANESSPSSSVADHASNSSAHLGVTPSPYAATGTVYRPSGSQDATYDAGSPIAAIDTSPDGHSAILAGRHILRVVNLQGTSIQSSVDLRAAILAQPVVKNSLNSVSDQLSIKDVKWLKGRGDTSVFTACANGKIFQYDLTRLGGGADGAPMEVIHMREDSRQINVLDINPRSSRLLAGSQDGIVRCFDILNPVRTHTGHLTFRAVQAFKCNAGGIQSLQWSQNPEGAFYFACGTEQGVVLKWDIRKATAPVLRINAHDKACTSLAWHPDGDHLVSAGWDRRCCVWDVSHTADRRQKPKCVISTPAPVADLAWRPATWSATAQGRRAAQLAVTYDDSSRQGVNACHIWDLARPTMPFKQVCDFESPPAALLWHDQDLLWTAGQDGLFNQFDIAYAPKVVDQLPTSVVAFSSQGDAVAFLDERHHSRRPHRTVVPTDMLHRTGHSSNLNAPMLSISRSDSEDEVAGSFLGAHRLRPRPRRTTTGSRSNQSLSTTPPGGPEAPIMALEPSIKAAGVFRAQQAMAIGRAPSASKVSVYDYLSFHYLETLHELLPYRDDDDTLDNRVQKILIHYAKASETIGHFRLAQVWRILAHAMHLLLPRRAQYHLDRRTGELERSDKARRKLRSTFEYNRANFTQGAVQPSNGNVAPGSNKTDQALEGGLKPPGSAEKASGLRSLLSEEFESTSNVPTPVARPVDSDDHSAEQHFDPADHRFEYGKKLTPVQEGGSFTVLPPPLQGRSSPRKRLNSEPISTFSQDSDAYASTEGYDFYDTETISKAIDVPSTKDTDGNAFESESIGSVRRIVARHESDESLQMFSISSGSRQTSGLTASSASSVRRRIQRLGGPAQTQPQLARSTSTGEYESRIRGEKIHAHDSPRLEHLFSAPVVPTELSATQSTEEDYPMVTQTTMDSVDSNRGESHPKPDSFPQDTPQTASVGVSPYASFEYKYDDQEQPRETDYMPWADDPLYPQPIAWEDDQPPLKTIPLDPLKVVSWAIEFESKSSALNASAMVMLLRPLIRNDEVIDPFRATAIIKQHHSRLMGLKLFTQASLLRKLCVKGWPGDPLREWGDDYPSVYRLSQSNNKAGFICPRCHKPREINRRNLFKPPNPIWQCERCTAVMAPCAICKHRDIAEPAVQIEITPEIIATANESQDESLLSTWWYCAGCGHGGHASCILGWHGVVINETPQSSVDGHGEGLYSDGCCPFDGCGHACLPGKYRAEAAVARTEEVSRVVREVNRRAQVSGTTSPRFSVSRYNTGAMSNDDIAIGARHYRRRPADGLDSRVHDDGNDVPQSRAVETVRESLAGHGKLTPMTGLRHVSSAIHLGGDSDSRSSSGAGILSSSPGRGIVNERERRKSVKFGENTVQMLPDHSDNGSYRQ